ncbi:hypothetical protein CALCODRAFT_482088 [Calocera cornea HHB12733]|uniref:Ubiquitin-like-conjugating enzyme ATG10 n=1 Tax=Calocera cornea HHB12733 TaxID=1353952 RepID=A0A165H393_9BASI|nr:hypothetical protein CALCODRAFT_482088 [Calocera cornea HHB12733]
MPEIPDDPAMFSDPQLSGTRITVEEHIVYSPTFQVPAFYFTASDSSGAPLPLPQVIRSTLFHLPLPLSTLSIHQHTVDLPGTSSDLPDPDPDPAPLPLLTQGEHPTTGRACWYIHPCETSAAVKELLDHRAAPIIEGWEVEWLRVWFVILGRVIYLRSS